MSWTKDITIWCDAEGCAEWVQGDALLARTVKVARRHAANGFGWVVRDGKDFCPQHRPVSSSRDTP